MFKKITNMGPNNKCSFCDLESFKHQVITENEYFFAIYSRRPLVKGHVMVLIKRHKQSFTELDFEETKSLFKLLNKLSEALHGMYNNTGINLFTNIGKSAGQSVPHLHFHLLPRFDDEEVSPFRIINDPEGYKKLECIKPEKMAEEIEKIRQYL